jgi:inosine kinase
MLCNVIHLLGVTVRFPGRRKSKHYFPVEGTGRKSFDHDVEQSGKSYIVGIDQILVDLEVYVDDQFLRELGIAKGESVLLDEPVIENLYRKLKEENKIVGEFAGGAIGNTLHNYSVLADGPSVALGAMSANIKVGDYAYKYICSTNSHVDLSFLMPEEGALGRAFCFVTPDGERTFAIGRGIMNNYRAEMIPASVIEKSSALVVSTYLLRVIDSPIYGALMRAVEIAKAAQVPVVLSLGTSALVKDMRETLLDFCKRYVTVLAGNENEFFELFKINDPLLALEESLNFVDMGMLTVGPKGLYLGALADDEHRRETKDQIHSKSIPEYNKYEYSRAQKRKDCKNPIKIYSHINPFLGGPLAIKNTNGAGDAAVAALLHDMAANDYHRSTVVTSPKHQYQCLTYSSIHQISKYCNRVSYEVLIQNSPRLSRGLPEREECLEEAYWAH